MDRRNQVAAGYRSVDPQAVDTGARWPRLIGLGATRRRASAKPAVRGGFRASSVGLALGRRGTSGDVRGDGAGRSPVWAPPASGAQGGRGRRGDGVRGGFGGRQRGAGSGVGHEPAQDPRFGADFGRRARVLRWDVGGRQGRRGGAEPGGGAAWPWGSSAGCREWCWARASARAAVRGGFRASSAGFALGRRGTSGRRGPGETRGRGLGERQGDGARGRPGARARGRPWATGPAEAARSAQGPGFPDTCRQSAPAASPATPPGRPTHPALPGHSRAPDRETAGRGARRGETSPSAGTFVLGSMKNPRGRIEIVVAF